MDYDYVIHYMRKGNSQKYEISGNSLDEALGVFFQDNGDVCYNDVTNIEENEN